MNDLPAGGSRPPPQAPIVAGPSRAFRVPLPRLAALAYRDYRLLFASSIALVLTQGMTQVAMAWLVLELTNSLVWMGFVTFAFGLPTFLLIIPAGLVADRWDRRKQLILSESAGVVTAFFFASLLYLDAITPHLALLFAFLSGSATAFGQPARQALVPLLVPRRLLLNGIALGAMSQSSTRLVGPAAAGMLLATVGFSATFYTLAGLLLVGVVCMLFMRTPQLDPGQTLVPETRNRDRRSIRQDLWSAIAFLWSTPPLLVLMFLYFLTGLLISGQNQALVPVLIRDHLGGDAVDLGLAFTVQSTGTMLIALYLTSQSELRNKGTWFAVSLVVASVMFAGYMGSPSYQIALVFFFLYGMAAGVFVNMSQTLMTSNTPGPLLGRVLSIYTLSLGGILPLGALLSGVLASVIGLQATALGGAVLAALAALTALVLFPNYRRLS